MNNSKRKEIKLTNISEKNLQKALHGYGEGTLVLVSKTVIESATREEQKRFWEVIQARKCSFQYDESSKKR